MVQNHIALARLATCLAVATAAAAPAHAQQSAGTVEARPSGPRAVPNGSIRPRSVLPLADFDALDRAQRSAPADTPLGEPGTSGSPGTSGNPGGSGDAGRSDARAYGTARVPYTTARVAVGRRGPSNSAARTPVTSYPFRATGKLLMRKGSDWTVCTGSLIKKSVVVTAAHCLHDYGKKRAGYVEEVRFYPSNVTNPFSSAQPFGMFTAVAWRVPAPYYNGTDTCSQRGVVCNNDIATITLASRAGRYAGQMLGTYRYGWNGYAQVSNPTYFKRRVVQITQLGYPLAFDSGYQMQRTDAVGWYLQSGQLKNTQIGSAQTGGSSGGPWIANFGTRPRVSAAAALGAAALQTVIGVTSYGSTTRDYNRQGASHFGQNREYPARAYGSYGAGNIGAIVQATCSARPWAC